MSGIFPAAVLNEPEASKKAADIKFALGQYEEAIKLYKEALENLSRLKGYPIGEVLTMRASANAAACYLKLNQYRPVVELCTDAIRLGSSSTELHLLGKLYHRRATALEGLEDYEGALLSLDDCIRIEMSNSEDIEAKPHAEWRDILTIKVVEKRDTIVSLPPEPHRVTSAQIEECIVSILQNGCNTKNKEMMKKLNNVVETRGYLDTRDSQGNTILWAVAHTAVLIASNKVGTVVDTITEKPRAGDADDVFPVLKLLIDGGASVNQRMKDHDQKTLFQLLCVAGATECVRYCLQWGAGPDVYDQQGWSPLLVACAVNSPKVRIAVGMDFWEP